MKILVINAGSSSLKYQLIDMENEHVLAKGLCERIGEEGSTLKHKTYHGKKKQQSVPMDDHKDAFLQVKELLLDKEYGVLDNLNEVAAVGHRVVHGGALFNHSVLVDESVIKRIEQLIPLAPLHNRAHVQGIRACMEVFGQELPQVVVFDTAFHCTMPPKAYMFAVPYEYYQKYQIRRYGFHGTSHRYVSRRCAELMGRDIRTLKIISCHLGNGSSITAIRGGDVIDTSMGLTPLDGVMMGTRSGTLDPSVVTFIEEKEHLTTRETVDLLNKNSGLLGVSGVSNDDRDVLRAAQLGNERAILAHEMLEYQITKFIGSYVAALEGCDALVFTAGIGENQFGHRKNICHHFSYLGLHLDEDLNEKTILGKEGIISSQDSKIAVFVIPTNEELMIARDTKEVVNLLSEKG